jgi:hypothetical protein
MERQGEGGVSLQMIDNLRLDDMLSARLFRPITQEYFLLITPIIVKGPAGPD